MSISSVVSQRVSVWPIFAFDVLLMYSLINSTEQEEEPAQLFHVGFFPAFGLCNVLCFSFSQFASWTFLYADVRTSSGVLRRCGVNDLVMVDKVVTRNAFRVSTNQGSLEDVPS